jgi:hypothetical protein
MASPFPGMDPYVETRWRSFHAAMLSAAMSQLNRDLPLGLEARTEEQVRIARLTDDDRETQSWSPDVAVVESAEESRVQPRTAGALAVAEPIRLPPHRGPVTLRSIHIVDARDGDRIVTAVELLSPWNKRAGRLNRDYRRKLRDFEDGGTNWVEVDLLRSPRTRLPVGWDQVPPKRRANYLVVIYRAFKDALYGVPISLRHRLPAIGVPLRPTDEDVSLDLQAAFDRAYEDGPFKSIDYARPLDPPLSEADAAWAAELVRPPPRV